MKKAIRNTIPGTIFAMLMCLIVILPSPVFAGGNIPVTIDIPLTYIVNGNEDAAGGDRFTLVPDGPQTPMPDSAAGGTKSVDIKREGTYSFGNIYYDRPGIWWYTITRDITEKKGVTKEDSVYRVKVIALNDGQGYVQAYRDGSDEKYEIVYTDRVAPETGDGSILVVYLGIALAAAAAFMIIAVLRRRNKNKEA